MLQINSSVSVVLLCHCVLSVKVLFQTLFNFLSPLASSADTVGVFEITPFPNMLLGLRYLSCLKVSRLSCLSLSCVSLSRGTQINAAFSLDSPVLNLLAGLGLSAELQVC